MRHVTTLQVRIQTQEGPPRRTSLLFRCTALFSLFFGLASPTSAQVGSVKTTVLVSAQGEVGTFWTVREAGLREDFTGTTGYLNVQNISDMPLDGAVFYGEYFDAVGRFCFSLVFSQDNNPVERGAIPRGESRVIDSVGSGLFPASEPKEVKVYLVQIRLPEQASSVRNWDVLLRAPITLSGGVQSYVQLGSEAASAEGSVLDLVLANVTVNEEGIVTSVEVLHAASNEVESWFRDFAAQQATFYPATRRDHPEQAKALVLVRAVLKEGVLQNLLLPPRMSPWVKLYMRGVADMVAPPVTNIVFARPASQLNRLGTTPLTRPPAPPGIFELAFYDSYWSSPAMGWVTDFSMPHHIRRQLIVSDAR